MDFPVQVRTLEVDKQDWTKTRLVDSTYDGLAEGEVLIRIDRMALTANNISYAGAGDALGYWGFFPTDEGWGRIPAMGWGQVVASAEPGIEVGERLWGFYPFANYLRVQAGDVKPGQFRDASPHRAEYAPVYAQFERANGYPIYEAAREDQDSLLRGLFMTSWLVEDFLTVNERFGASSCLITSASSKTSIALAHCVNQRGALRSVGLTSAGNRAFCESLGCYDVVVTYDEIASLDAGEPVVMVDMAGSASLLTTIHEHFQENMKHSCRIGATHYDDMGPTDHLPGATPEFFFAPTHVQTRSKELGSAQLMMQLGAAFVGFRQFCDSWLQVEFSAGPDAVEATYQQVLKGSVPPAMGQIISLWG